MRCKNFTTFSSFSAITTLERVETLDLSVSPDSRQTCYVYDEIKRANYSLESLNASLTLLKSVGSPNEAPTSPKTISLTVALLNLRANQIERFTLTRNAFALSQNSRVFIHSIDLDHNLVRDLHVFTHMDICFYGVHNVTLAHNRLAELDVGFLVMLRHLSVKHNRISSFRIDFFERDKQARAHASCITTSRLNRTFVVFDSVLTSLDFSHNRLASLPFSYLTNVNFGLVESLNFSRNRVGSLKNYEFNGMKKLSHLMLDGNNIEHSEPLALHGLHSVKRLDLSENALVSLPDDLFNRENLTVELVSLSQNKLDRVPRKTLRHCNATKYLYLNQNRISRVENFAFGFMFNLLELYLSGNRIEELEPDAFQIDDDSIIGPGLVEKLDISNNRLTYLNNSVFSYLTNLRYLLLNNNMIKVIGDEAFLGVNYMITLDLNINALEDLSFLHKKTRFSRLRYLKLSNNQLESVDATLFAHLSSLKILDLSSNRIKNVSDCAFYGLENSIDKLILNYNAIEEINPCAFSIDFKNLRFVQILHNPINCTNTCGFFFTVYNPPYSIKYEGYECSDGTIRNFTFCSQLDYQKIYSDCRAKMRGPDNCLKISSNKQAMKRNAMLMRENEKNQVNASSNAPKSQIYLVLFKYEFFLLEIIVCVFFCYV